MSVYRRGRVLWIRYAGPGGDIVRESTGQNDQRAADRLLRDRKREVAAGTWRARAAGEAARPTVAQFSEGWLDRLEARKVRTIRDYRSRTRDHVLPLLGDRHLDDLRPRDVARFVLDLTRRDLAPRTVRHVYDCLRSLCRDAVIEEVIAASPCVLTPGTLPAARDADPAWRMTALFTRDELEQLFSAESIPEDRRVLYAMQGLAGLRFGEVAGRHWRDLDTIATPLGRLVVATQYAGARLKTDAPREVPVHPTLAAILARWKSAGWPEMLGRHPRPDDLIIPSRRGKLRSVRLGHTRLLEDLERLGFRARRQHDLRRSFVSLARADGARTEVLRAITHGASQSVIDLYTTWPWGTLCDAVIGLKIADRGPTAPVVPLRMLPEGSVGRGLLERHLDAQQQKARELPPAPPRRRIGPSTPPCRVYFLADTDGSVVKIGAASDVAGRVREIQTMNHRPLQLLASMPGDIHSERALHRQFAAARLTGEWFRLTSEIRAFIVARASLHVEASLVAPAEVHNEVTHTIFSEPDSRETGSERERGGRDLKPPKKRGSA